MNKDQIIQEIERVKTAMSKTKSPYLKRDYTKHLIKLKKILGKMSNGQ